MRYIKGIFNFLVYIVDSIKLLIDPKEKIEEYQSWQIDDKWRHAQQLT